MTPDEYRDLRELFLEVVDLGTAERSRLLAEKCRGRDDLRQEIESLLACDTELPSDLDGSSSRGGAKGLPARPSPIPQAVPQADRYVIERELGHGGMGRVLLVYDRDLGRRVAMKVLRDPAADADQTARFLREARATAQLEHPNIGPVYDVGAAGAPFFTMKWIRGRNLEEVLASGTGTWSLLRLLQIVQQAAMGVDYAHSKSVIHRDLKPQNIMVGDFGEVFVVDWGLAKVVAPSSGAEESAVVAGGGEPDASSLAGAVKGSVQYMAPEQARGDAGAIGERTDVFGLGGILYRVLTGAPLYSEESLEATLESARRGDVVPPSLRAPGRAIPHELEAICLKALSRRPEDRFPSARDFHEGLQRHLEKVHDAERRALEARQRLQDAEKLRDELRIAEELAKELEKKAQDLDRELSEAETVESKSALLTHIEEGEAVADRLAQLYNQTVTAYNAVLSIAPTDPGARGALAEIFHARMAAAEARGESEVAAFYEGLVGQYHDGRFERELRGEVAVRFETSPPGAMVLVSRYVKKGLLLVESERQVIGATPVAKPLPRGSYLAVLKKPGCADVRFPFLLDRSPAFEASVDLVPA
ncbi:MAG: protein kinase, partial [Planctomycetes bacterium]|nr:protein kinase [Planctomycetota bacterium]